MQYTSNIMLPLNGDNSTIITHAKQGDINSRVLLIELDNGGKPYPLDSTITARYCIKKSDTVQNLNDATIVDGKVKITWSVHDLSTNGVFPCEVQLYQADTLLTSSTFRLHVTDAVYNPNVLDAVSFPSLQAQIDEIKAFVGLV